MIVKRILQIWILALVSLPLIANPVTPGEAREKAAVFFETHGKRITPAPSHVRTAEEGQEASPYYIFNAAEEGFVIISGDDAAGDILGYSTQGHYDEEKIPEGMQALLTGYAHQINLLRETPTRRPSKRIIAHESIAPLVTTTWSQGNATEEGGAYNLLCPMIDSKHTLAGCVAIAMAQILNYHQWPREDCEEIPAYSIGDGAMALEALPPMTFDWGNILCTYNGTETDEERMAVAQLALYCGQASKTHYGLEKSEAFGNDAAKALREYFNMSSKLQYVKSADYTAEEWDKIIYNELSSSRPVLYFGYSTADGHAFICDGYDGNDFYHINWGWGGDCDGYFKLSILNPNGDNSGNTYSYSLNQHAIIGIRPNIESEDIIQFTDETAKSICIDHWDSDADGELSYEEANVVLSLDNAFTGNTELKDFNELQYFRGLKSIGPSAFAGCTGLASIEMPPTILEIKENAFSGCNGLLSLIIPEGVNVIENEAFFGCTNINRIYVKTGNTTYDSRENCHAIIETGTNTLVLGCQNTVIPITVTNIGASAFAGCEKLVKLQIPENVTHIYNGAFEACTNLKEVSFPSSLYTIGDKAFFGNSSLMKIIFPQAINSIGSQAFAGCKKMTTMIVSNPVPALCGDDAFDDCHPTLYVPNGAKEAYQEAKEWSKLSIEELKENDYLTCSDTTFTKAHGGRLTIKMRNNDTVIGLQFQITLPEGISIRQNEDEEYDITKTSRVSNQTYYCTQQKDGSYLVLVMSMSMAPIAGHDGTILEIGIVCDEEVEPGEYDVNFSEISISTIDRGTIVGVRPLPFTSKVKVRQFDMGDVDGNNRINVTDVMLVVNHILGYDSQIFMKEFADLDFNQHIDVTDVMRIVQIILNQSTSTPQPSEEEPSVSTSLAPASPGIFTLHVDDGRDLTALQMKVRLPKTSILKSVKLRDGCSNGHQTIVTALGDGLYNVVVFNLSGQPFRHQGGELLDFVISGPSQAISVYDIFFTDTSHETLSSEENTLTDGIDDITTDDLAPAPPAYNLQGQRIGRNYHGITVQGGQKRLKR
jgi:hypothetical protein